MNKKEFVKVVGKLPFSGKHKIRHAFAEGVRGARRGNQAMVDSATGVIDRVSSGNAIMSAAGFVTAGFLVKYGIDQETWQFTPETVVSAAAGVGHAISAGAQLIIRSELTQRPVLQSSVETAGHLLPYTRPQEPTNLEKIVSFGGPLASMVATAHMAIYIYT